MLYFKGKPKTSASIKKRTETRAINEKQRRLNEVQEESQAKKRARWAINSSKYRQKKLAKEVFKTMTSTHVDTSFEDLFAQVLERVNDPGRAILFSEPERQLLRSIVFKIHESFKSLIGIENLSIDRQAKQAELCKKLLVFVTNAMSDILGVTDINMEKGALKAREKLSEDFRASRYVHLLDWYGGNLEMLQRIANFEVDKKGNYRNLF